MAKTDQRQRKRPAPPTTRKKNCYFCREKVEQVDYKNIHQLRR
jgi:ribosomal protein S18